MLAIGGVQFWGDWIVWLAGVVIAVGVIIRYLVIPTVRGLRKAARFLADVHTVVERELTKNGGSSIRDRVERMDERQEEFMGAVMTDRADIRRWIEDHDQWHDTGSFQRIRADHEDDG